MKVINLPKLWMELHKAIRAEQNHSAEFADGIRFAMHIIRKQPILEVKNHEHESV